jgi:hypothetical protein
MIRIFGAFTSLMMLGIFCFGLKFTEAYFSQSCLLENNKITLGDWTGPVLEIVQAPQGDVAYSNLRIKVRGVDSFSTLKNFEYLLFSHNPESFSSDQVSELNSIYFEDVENNILTREVEILLPLDKIENSSHKLCASNEMWCENKPLPSGEYYLVVRAYDTSETLNSSGNRSEDLIYQFNKKDAQIICGLTSIKAKAGEGINFPDIACLAEPELKEIKWDLDNSDGINLDDPDLVGNAPFLEGGILIPGTYSAFVEAKSVEGKTKSQSFEINIGNPSLFFGDLIINEFLPDPIGDDKALAPGGEWIEIYNSLETGVDLLGFMLYDDYDNHDLPIVKNNCQDYSSVIFPHSYKLIYRNGDADFSLNNSGPERVRLFSGFIENESVLLDSCEYSEKVLEGNSLARIPDLGEEFYQINPTPGEINKTP